MRLVHCLKHQYPCWLAPEGSDLFGEPVKTLDGKALLTLWSEDDNALEFRVSTVRNYSIWAANVRGQPSALRAGPALGRLRSGFTPERTCGA